jgi:hypothetical protein
MNTLEKYQYILLADQPWQANLMCALAKDLLCKDPNAQVSLVLTDYYTFLLRRDYLEGIRVAFPGRVVTIEKHYRNWQSKTAPVQVDANFLTDWEKKYCTHRSLKQIEKTNQWIYGNERNAYQRKIGADWAERILVDTIDWVETLVHTSDQPAVIVSIERSTLPTNLLFEIAKTRKIPFLTFFPSRINSRWLMRDDFGYGMSNKLLEYIQENYSSSDLKKQARELIQEELTRKEGSYVSIGHTISAKIRNGKINSIRIFVHELRLWMGRVYGRIFIQPRERSIPAIRLVENLVSLSYVEIRRIFQIQMRSLGIKFWGTSRVPEQKYFFWALHMRPEGSVLVLGDGKDEITELFRTVKLLPDGYFLVVKENPEMFGLRAPGFYRKLKRHPRIIMIDAFVSTYSLIQNSIGVIGISGTVLLEATFFNKPSCALGKPEFSKFLTENGWNAADRFFNNVLNQQFSEPLETILPYIAYVLGNSSTSDIAFDGDLSVPGAGLMIKRFTKEIHNHLANLK